MFKYLIYTTRPKQMAIFLATSEKRCLMFCGPYFPLHFFRALLPRNFTSPSSYLLPRLLLSASKFIVHVFVPFFCAATEMPVGKTVSSL